MIHSLIILTLFLVAILLVPLVCHKIHVPSLVGFILVGMVFGLCGLPISDDNPTIHLFGQLGMLYIMFQAGVEIDMNDFHQQRKQALLFGFLSFLFPFALGLLTSRWMGFAWTTSLLLGAMYGSHTLMTYPIVSRYGVQKTPAANIAVGGTMLTITLSLLVLAILEEHTSQTGDFWVWIGKLVLFLGSIIYIFPKISQWFFKRWQDESLQFVLVMAFLVSSALLADWAGLEGILGAFLCGVALNGRVPNRSQLMGRINFIGNTIFVPIFLMGVGLMVDIHTFHAGWWIILIALVMIITKLVGKWLASWAGQRLFHLLPMERQLMFGLTHATAAGTLAIVTIGYQAGFFNAEILNGAIVMILVLCTISSFVTEHAAKELALLEDAKIENDSHSNEWSLIGVNNTMRANLEQLATFGQLPNTHYAECDETAEAQTMIEHNSRTSIIYKEQQPLNTISRILVAVPRYAEKEQDFISCFGFIRRLSGQISAKVTFFATAEARQALKAFSNRPGKFLRASYQEIEDWEDVMMMARETKHNDLVVFLSARQSTPSYNPLFAQLPSMLSRFYADYSQLIVYPEQDTESGTQDIILTDIPQASSTWRIVTKIKQGLLHLIHRIQLRQ